MLGEPMSQAALPAVAVHVSSEYVAEAYGQALVELGEWHPNLVVLDGDLSSDCRLSAGSRQNFQSGSSRTGLPNKIWFRWRVVSRVKVCCPS